MSALFHETRTVRRVYRPDEAPDEAREKACEHEAQGIEAEHLSESVFGTCPETGIGHDERKRGVAIETTGRGRPSWRILDKGAGVSLLGSVVDVDTFLAFLLDEGKLTRDEARRLRYVEREGGISLRMLPRHGYGEGTRTDFDAGGVDWPSAEIDEALETLSDAWDEYVARLCRNTVEALETEWRYLSSWDTIAERLRDFDEGIDDEGRAWPLSECEERPDPDDDDDEGAE